MKSVYLGFAVMDGLTRRQFIATATGLAVASSVLTLPARGSTINPRSTWGSNYQPKGPLQSEDVKFLIVHHSASRNGAVGADGPAALRSWFNYHTGPDKGWNDVAYNFVIDSGGGIWEARQGSLDGPVAGDATGGNQGFTQLVCLIGDFNTAQPSPAALGSLVALLAWLADRYGVSTSPGSRVTFESRGSNRWPAGTSVTTPTITGHRSMSKTTCPGSNLNNYVVGGLDGRCHRCSGRRNPQRPGRPPKHEHHDCSRESGDCGDCGDHGCDDGDNGRIDNGCDDDGSRHPADYCADHSSGS